MGIWSPAAYDALLLEKTKILLGAALENPKRRGGPTSLEQFVRDLDTQDKSSQRVFEALLYQTTSRRPRPSSSSAQPSAEASTITALPSHRADEPGFLPPRGARRTRTDALSSANALFGTDPTLSIRHARAPRHRSPDDLDDLTREMRRAQAHYDEAHPRGPRDDAGVPRRVRPETGLTREALFGPAVALGPSVAGERAGTSDSMRMLLDRQAEDTARAPYETIYLDSSDDDDDDDVVLDPPVLRPAAPFTRDHWADDDGFDDSLADDDEFADSLGRIQDLLPERVGGNAGGGGSGSSGEGIWRAEEEGWQGINVRTIDAAMAYERLESARDNALREAGARRTPAAFREELERAAEGVGREGFEGAFAGFARRRRAQARDGEVGEPPAAIGGSTQSNTTRSSTPSIAIDTPSSSLAASPPTNSLCPPSPRSSLPSSLPTTSAAIAEAAARDRRVRPLPSRTPSQGSNDDDILPLTALGSSLSEEDRASVLQRLYSLAAARAEGRRT